MVALVLLRVALQAGKQLVEAGGRHERAVDGDVGLAHGREAVVETLIHVPAGRRTGENRARCVCRHCDARGRVGSSHTQDLPSVSCAGGRGSVGLRCMHAGACPRALAGGLGDAEEDDAEADGRLVLRTVPCRSELHLDTSCQWVVLFLLGKATQEICE